MNMDSIRLTPLTRRRLQRFRSNRRGWWSLWIFVILFITTLLAEVIANDKPFMVYFKGEVYFPIVKAYPETTFGGDFLTEADYRKPLPQRTDRARRLGTMAHRALSPSHGRVGPTGPRARAARSKSLAGYGRPGTRCAGPRNLRLQNFSAVWVRPDLHQPPSLVSPAGAVQGYFGGWLDLIFQRFMEIWSGLPTLYLLNYS
ncbi:MAG: hypothetical protein CM1200mP41_17520 [Gammaproteobacteria bacterium]|nr:MAG: hypothetical protein CM1200mP41_17520 [Gammaproteobacteria bacterium]